MPSHQYQSEWIAATLPKSGNRPEENEDALAVSKDGLRFAVCDGASEGWESGRWAARLATAFVRKPPTPATFTEWLEGVREGWMASGEAESTSWYAAVKQEQGSFATLVGIELLHTKWAQEWSWKAVAIGDSCLLHLRDDEVKATFPLTFSNDFGNQPPLVPSAQESECSESEWLAGRAKPGDVFLLATDAVAAQLLDKSVRSIALTAVREARESGETKPLENWLRSVQSRTNDDATLVAVRLPLHTEAQ